MFVTFEGIDRSGKTTQARMLAEALGDDAVLVREPGGTPAAERIRELVKGDTELTSMAETLLFGAARADLVECVIRPALDRGMTVIGDRYIDSTVAYQGGARGLGIEQVEQLNAWLTGDLWPDITFLLDVDAATAADRGGELDRFEREGEALQRAVARAYDELAARHSHRYVRLDASRAPQDVHSDVVARLPQVRA
jgi:dTMP kinase